MVIDVLVIEKSELKKKKVLSAFKFYALPPVVTSPGIYYIKSLKRKMIYFMV